MILPSQKTAAAADSDGGGGGDDSGNKKSASTGTTKDALEDSAAATTTTTFFSSPPHLLTSAAAVNLSTASTTAFFRHNCPLPNDIDHHHQYHQQHQQHQSSLAEDSTEKVLLLPHLNQLPTADDHHLHPPYSTNAPDSDWLLYGDLQAKDDQEEEEDDPDTDASIDILEEGEAAEEVAPGAEVLESVAVDIEDSKSAAADDDGLVEHIRVEFTAHNRLFRLRLHSNSERVFAPDAVLEMADGRPIHYEMSNVIRGHLEGKMKLFVVL